MIIETVLVLTILYFIVSKLRNSDKRKLPPGPFQLPIVGNLIAIARAHSKRPDLALAILAKKYGNVMSLKFGMHDAVVLSSYEAMADLLGKDEFADRFQGFGFVTDRSFHKSLGLIFQSGAHWRKLRNYLIRTLRDYGLNKSSSMEIFLNDELTEFMSELEAKLAKTAKGNGILTIEPELFALSFVNILWCSVAGFRFSHSDQKLNRILQLNEEVMKAVNFDSISLPYPFLRHWFPEMTNYNHQMKVFTELQGFMRDLIGQIKVKYELESSGEPRNYVENFLQNIKKSSNDADTIFTEEQLIMVLKDFFTAGSETTANVLTYGILYLVLHPDVQKKVQVELDDALPEGHLVSLTDLSKLPYTEATILEILRMANVVPLAPARCSPVDYEYKGYLIKKGTCVLVNMGCALNDRAYWVDPDQFRPERFLNESRMAVLAETSERVVAFGNGKRICMGQSLARLSILTYLTTFLKKYSFEIPKGNARPTTVSIPNMTLKPYPFEARVVPKKK